MSFSEINTELVTHINEYLVNIFNKLLFVKCDQSNVISGITSELGRLKFVESDDVFQMASVVGKAESLVQQSIDVLNTINTDKITQASQTYLLELKGEIFEYISISKTFLNLPENHAKYIEIAVEIKDDPKVVEQKYYNNNYSHKLFAAWLQYCIDNNKYKKDVLLSMAERAKDNAISMDKTAKPYDKSKFPLQRFNMIPIIQSASISDISEHFFKVKCSTIDKLAKSANMKSVGLIVMHLTTPRPMEYNIENLIDSKKVAKSFSPEKHGVSAKTLDRFMLTKFSEQSGELWYKCERFCTELCKKYILIRTLNGKTWDAMDFCSPEMAEKIMRGPSPRIWAVQKRNNDLFAKHLSKPINEDIVIKRENKSLIDNLIHRITNNLIEYVDKSLLPLPTSKIEIECAIRDPKFIEILNTETLRSFADSGIDTDSNTFAELMSSFASVVSDRIIVQFSRALKINMIERGPKLKLFKETSIGDLPTKLYTIFVDVVKFSVESTIRSKENIFEKIIIKSHMLNIIKKKYII